MEIKNKIFQYMKENGSTEFIEKFFGIKPTQKDFERFKKFKEAIKLKLQAPKISYRKIARLINIDPKVVANWINLKEIPFIVQMLKIYLKVGDPKRGWKWLPINVGFGQTLDGPWIQVPMAIKSFENIREAINQLEPFQNSIEKIKKFFDTYSHERLKLEIFAYVLGFIIGDFGKKKNKQICSRVSSRSLSLKLTKKVLKNALLGEFICNCARALGLRIKRLRDQIDKTTNAARFYWESQYSIFIEWIFRVCLGLRNGETTTTHPLRMSWIFSAPDFFKIRFIQGLGDSDGCINMQARCCNVASYPNTNFIKHLIEQLGIKTRIDNTPDGPVVAMTPREAIKLPLFFPNENISHRYDDLKAYVNARKKIGRGTPDLIKELIKNYRNEGKKKAEIMKILAHKHKYIVSHQTLSRYYGSN
jgi:hypothetical protein